MENNFTLFVLKRDTEQDKRAVISVRHGCALLHDSVNLKLEKQLLR